MHYDTLTDSLEVFRAFVESDDFHPDMHVEGYGIRNHCPVMVVLKNDGDGDDRYPYMDDVLERVQILAANGASWRCYPEDFAHALFLCVAPQNHESIALLKIIMSMPFASPVHVRTLLLEHWMGGRRTDEALSLVSLGLWWHSWPGKTVQQHVDFADQMLATLHLTPLDFEPYFDVEEYNLGCRDAPIKILHAAMCRRWSPLRASWVGAVAGMTRAN